MNLEEMKDRILSFLMDKSVGAKKIKEIEEIFCFDKISRGHFESALEALSREGSIFISKKGKIGTLEKFNMERGVYRGSSNGYGFVSTDEKDIFIPADDTNGTMDGDTVIVKLVKDEVGNKNAEGVVVKIIDRANKRLVGTIEINKSFAFVVPDNKNIPRDIFIPKKYISGAKDKDKVVVEITVWEEDMGKSHEGKVVEILGKSGDIKTEIDAMIRSKGLSLEFPRKVLLESEKIPESVDEDDLMKRLDFREHLIYTIDGDDSKDFDDAIEVYRLDNGNYRLGVHIADVAEYVKRDSILDKEAYKRATSVYLADRVLPMLPERLSNGICSLNPDVDRLTLSCIMDINPKNGEVENYNICESVIRSKMRMTYSEVNALYSILDSDQMEKLDKDETVKLDKYKSIKLKERYSDFLDTLNDARELSNIIRSKRIKKGALEFDFPEYKVVLEDEFPVDFVEYERGISNKMIEDFMILANEVVSEHFNWSDVPFLYRVHETPEKEKMESLRDAVMRNGYRARINTSDVKPYDLQRILNSIENKDDKERISNIMLRSLKQARYSSDAIGHFGLALKFYSHFTSPIRRYPDLFIHRIIKDNLRGEFFDKIRSRIECEIEEVADHTSERERNAELLERDVKDFFKSVYMKDKIGEVFDSKISGITSFGIFVKLENGIEGLIRYSIMDNFMEYVEDRQEAVDEVTKTVYKIGMPLKVSLINVSVSQRNIDFMVYE